MKSNTEERDKDLFEAYKEIIDRSPHPICLMEILKQAVIHPAKRFYISSRRVFEVITQIRSGETLEMTPERKRMFNDIIKSIEEQESKYPDKPLKYIIEDVLDMPAPEFYLKPTSAKIILHYERKRQKHIQQMQIQSRNERMEKRRLRLL